MQSLYPRRHALATIGLAHALILVPVSWTPASATPPLQAQAPREAVSTAYRILLGRDLDYTRAAARGPRGGAAARGPRGTVARGPQGGVAARGAYGGAVARGPAGNVAVRPGYRPPVPAAGWYRPPSYWWRPGGAIAAGAALGFITAAAAAAYVGPAPASGQCWYYTNPQRTQGFWDVCPR